MREGLAVITGTTHGIGRVTAQELARAGYRVIMLCRNEPLAREVATQIRSAIPQARVDVLACDLAHPATIRRSALVLRERFGPIDRLILNAGIATLSNQRTAAGLDLNFAVNHLGHFLLVELLRDQMAAGGRILTVASRAHFRGRLDADAVADPAERIRATASYARSKLANVLHSLALARQLKAAVSPPTACTPVLSPHTCCHAGCNASSEWSGARCSMNHAARRPRCIWRCLPMSPRAMDCISTKTRSRDLPRRWHRT